MANYPVGAIQNENLNRRFIMISFGFESRTEICIKSNPGFKTNIFNSKLTDWKRLKIGGLVQYLRLEIFYFRSLFIARPRKSFRKFVKKSFRKYLRLEIFYFRSSFVARPRKSFRKFCQEKFEIGNI